MHRVHDPVYGYMPLEDYETKLVDTMLIQRLRGIHQQGTAYLTYPSSTHTRFSHSLGVMKLTTDIINIMRRKGGIYLRHVIPTLLLRSMRLIALWHDVGHGPFSHVSDRIFRQKLQQKEKTEMAERGLNSCHEYFTCRLVDEYLPLYLEIIKPDYEEFTRPQIDFMTGQAVISFDFLMRFLKNSGALFFDKRSPLFFTPLREKETLWYYKAFKQIIDSDFDVDKVDYIQRDGYITGVKFGHLDVAGLYENLEIDDREGQKDFAFGRPALSAIETLVLERYKLYRWLNFHHTVCFSDEVMARVMELSQDVVLEDNLFTYDTFKSIAEAGLKTLQSGQHQYGVEMFDDYSIITNVRHAYRSQGNHNPNLKLARYYLGLIENRNFYDAIWRVDSELSPQEEILLFELKNSIAIELDSGIPPMQGLVGKIESEIAQALNRDSKEVLIAHKPFEPVPPDIKIKVVTDQGVVNISEVSAVVALLQQRRNRSPETTRENIARGISILLRKKKRKGKELEDFTEKIRDILKTQVKSSAQVFTPIYAYVKGISRAEAEKIRPKVFDIIGDNLGK